MKSFPLFVGILGCVFVTRLPFLHAGYGIDPDAWRVVLAARSIATSGNYEPSRLPGYPLQELTYSLFAHRDAFFFNGITAALGAAGIAWFALTLRRFGCKDYLLAGMTLACTPVIFINSTTSMDYVWTLSFMLGSLYWISVGQLILSGVFLGLRSAAESRLSQ